MFRSRYLPGDTYVLDRSDTAECDVHPPWRERSVGHVHIYPVHETVLRYLSVMIVFSAEVQVENRLRRHIEGCIGWNLGQKHPEDALLGR